MQCLFFVVLLGCWVEGQLLYPVLSDEQGKSTPPLLLAPQMGPKANVVCMLDDCSVGVMNPGLRLPGDASYASAGSVSQRSSPLAKNIAWSAWLSSDISCGSGAPMCVIMELPTPLRAGSKKYLFRMTLTVPNTDYYIGCVFKENDGASKVIIEAMWENDIPGEWTHFSCVVGGTSPMGNKKMTLYKNGISIKEGDIPTLAGDGSITEFVSGGCLYMGGSMENPGLEGVAGDISHVYIGSSDAPMVNYNEVMAEFVCCNPRVVSVGKCPFASPFSCMGSFSTETATQSLLDTDSPDSEAPSVDKDTTAAPTSPPSTLAPGSTALPSGEPGVGGGPQMTIAPSGIGGPLSGGRDFLSVPSYTVDVASVSLLSRFPWSTADPPPTEGVHDPLTPLPAGMSQYTDWDRPTPAQLCVAILTAALAVLSIAWAVSEVHLCGELAQGYSAQHGNTGALGEPVTA